MLLTVCTIAQLPDALTLGASFEQHHPGQLFVIGLADDPARLPAGFQCPYPLITAADCAADIPTLSALYTPTEFRASIKPVFIQAALSRYPDEADLLYADPETFVYRPLTAVYEQLRTATVLLTPHITRPPDDAGWPDEKALQNVGLYSAGFLAFRRGAETARLLAWWQDRVREHAFIDPCAGLWTDQIWLMHWLAFFEGVRIIKDAGWQLALWNLPERRLTQTPDGWRANDAPLLFANFRGLQNMDAGFFPYQTRIRLASRPELQQLLTTYRTNLLAHELPVLRAVRPAFGLRREPVVLRGWQKLMTQIARQLTDFIDRVELPVFH